MKRKSLLMSMLMLLVFGILAVVPATAQDDFVFGLVLVGPKNDGGWSSGAL